VTVAFYLVDLVVCVSHATLPTLVTQLPLKRNRIQPIYDRFHRYSRAR
jgi:hypothetical protein